MSTNSEYPTLPIANGSQDGQPKIDPRSITVPGTPLLPLIDATTFPDPASTPTGALKGTLENFARLLEIYSIRVRFNMMKKRPEVEIPDLQVSGENRSEVVLSHIRSLCSRHRMPKADVPEYLLTLADRQRYHPMAEWIDQRPWDGRDRLPEICGTITVAESYPRSLADILIQKWLLSVVAAVYGKGDFRNRGVLTFQGPQGIGKSTWFQKLISDFKLGKDAIRLGHSWDGGNKDGKLNAVKHVIVELGELEGSFKRELPGLKTFLTESQDKIRVPYARTESEYDRRTVFGASVNDAEFLADHTGNSRFWTIDAVKIDYRHQIDMQQVFAQLKVKYEAEGQWWLDEREEQLLADINLSHRTVSVVYDRIRAALDLSRRGRADLPRLTAVQVLQKIGIEHPTNPQAKEANAALRELIGEPRKVQGSKLWYVPWAEPDPDPWKKPFIDPDDEF